MNLILYNHYCRFAGRLFAKALDEWGFYNPPERLVKKATKVIRWGFYEDLHTNCPQINSQESILLASSKFRALRTLAAAGVPVPKHCLNNGQQDAKFFGEGMWLGRKFNHTGGTDVVIDIEDNDDSDYYTKYIKPHREWRVHVFKKKILFIQKKFFAEGKLHDDGKVIKKTKISEIVRSYGNGWRFYRLKDKNNCPSNVRDASVCAVNALGLTFGAVDVISYGRDGDKRKAAVLEVNTAPGLDEGVGMEEYLKEFKKWLAE
jgi:hypothetical protein